MAPCGVCGQKSEAECVLSIKAKSMDRRAQQWAFVECKSFGTKSFGMNKAAQVTKTSPSTNRPVKCPVENCNATVWTYNLAHHWTQHPSVEASDEAIKLATVSAEEFTRLKYTGRAKPARTPPAALEDRNLRTPKPPQMKADAGQAGAE